MANKIKVGITQGDSAGVGWEVILGALADPRMNELATFVVYGSRTAVEHYKKLSEDRYVSSTERRPSPKAGEASREGGNADSELKNTRESDSSGNSAGVQFHTVQSARQANPKGVSLVNVDEGGSNGGAASEFFEPGVPTPASGSAAVKALKLAAADLKEGTIDVLVTAPISKENSQSPDFNFTGHTEWLASEFPAGSGGTNNSAGGFALMMMCSEGLRVALVTAHMALADVPGAISKEKIVEKLRVLHKTLIQDFGVVAPKIAVLALNPHAGEGGLMGTDEAEVIKPAIDEAYAEGILAFGPLAADGLFLSGEYTKYDALLAMYHDQGLAPFKALAPDGVNFTAGLSAVRTSPDHGTAFDIAGRGLANPASMRNAIYTAIDIFRNRATHAEASHNPLKHYEREKGDERTIDLSKSEL